VSSVGEVLVDDKDTLPTVSDSAMCARRFLERLRHQMQNEIADTMNTIPPTMKYSMFV
jgi:hypothetical protein